MTDFGLPRHPQREELSPDAKIRSLSLFRRQSQTGRFPLLFVLSGVKLNSQRQISDILEGCMLLWAKKLFQGVLRFLQQESALSHASKITESWIQRKIRSFIRKEVWPARSPDLPFLDFSIWSILENRVCFSPIPTIEALKAKLVRE